MSSFCNNCSSVWWEIRRTVFILTHKQEHTHMHVVLPSPHFTSTPSPFRLFSFLLVLSALLSYFPDWDHHWQLERMSFSPKAIGAKRMRVGDVRCNETAGILGCSSNKMPTCSFGFSSLPLFSDLRHPGCSSVWLIQGEWCIQLSGGIQSIVSMSLRISWMLS